jgi:hypothetical protein
MKGKSMGKENFVVIHKELDGNLALSVVLTQMENGDSQLHTLICQLGPHGKKPHQGLDQLVGFGGIVDESLTPIFYTTSAVFRAPLLSGKDVTRDSLESWASNGGIKLDEYTLNLKVCARALSKQLGITGVGGILIPSLAVREALISGVIAAWGFAAFNGKMPREVGSRVGFYFALETFFSLMDIENNIKVYSNAFGFSREKAHKDVRTYRLTYKKEGAN